MTVWKAKVYRVPAGPVTDADETALQVERLQTVCVTLVRQWGQSLESADRYTFGHCERVAAYAETVATELGFDEAQRTTVRVGAYLHDLGKVRLPRHVLNKPGPLTPREFDLVQRHPVWGEEILATVDLPWDIRPMIRWHHEKYDGSGYPDRLRGEEIPTSAQIIGIVDVYDALTSSRAYHPALPRAHALAEIRACRPWWRPDVYDAFVRAVGSAVAGDRSAAPAA